MTEIEKLEKQNKKLRETVEHYASKENWEFWARTGATADTRAWQTLKELDDEAGK